MRERCGAMSSKEKLKANLAKRMQEKRAGASVNPLSMRLVAECGLPQRVRKVRPALALQRMRMRMLTMLYVGRGDSRSSGIHLT